MLKMQSRTVRMALASAVMLSLGACSSFDMFSARENACADVPSTDYPSCIKTWRETRQRETDTANAAMNENLDERTEDDAR